MRAEAAFVTVERNGESRVAMLSRTVRQPVAAWEWDDEPSSLRAAA
jgi:hypothetical protein